MSLVERAGKILTVSIILLSMIVILISFIHLYAKWFCSRREENPTTHRRRRRRQEPYSGVTVLRRGLNPSFLKTIPVVPFDLNEFKEGLECAVCLSEVCEGEKTRILPKCDHGFHVECVDMWFYSHLTCPICRNPVVSVEENLLETQEEESTDFPTNVLFWGDETEVSILTSQLEEANSYNQAPARVDLVIDIPRQINSDCDEEDKSPVSVSSRMRRILSGSRRFMFPFSPCIVNDERGNRGHV